MVAVVRYRLRLLLLRVVMARLALDKGRAVNGLPALQLGGGTFSDLA